MAVLRLDKYLADQGLASRKELREIIRSGRVAVDGLVCREADRKVDPEKQTVLYDGEPIRYQRFRYFMMDKPIGVVTATEDREQKTVLDLLPASVRALGLFPVGRLDKDTSGLLLLTNDGDFAHRLISPKFCVEKRYYAIVDGEVDAEDVAAFAQGLTLRDGTCCRPARLEPVGPGACYVTVTEGKYTLTEARYAKGEIFQYDMPDFDAEYTVPKLGFFSSPVRFPAVYEGKTPWMSVCPSEILSMQEDIAPARGNVLVLGLGLGYYPFMISGKPEVKDITVVERSPEIVKLFETHLLPQFPFDYKIEIAQCDAYDYLDEVEPGEFDFIYCDLWMGAADGVEHYRRLKEYEAKLPTTEFRYWLEPQLRAFS